MARTELPPDVVKAAVLQAVSGLDVSDLITLGVRLGRCPMSGPSGEVEARAIVVGALTKKA